MKNNNSEDFQRKLAKYINERLDKIEIYLGVVLMIAFITDRFSDVPAEIIYKISLSTLAICFASSAYYKPEGMYKIQYFFMMIACYALSISSIGILFEITKWPGGNMMCVVGLIGSLIALIAFTIDRIKNTEEDYPVSIRWLIRLAVMSFILIAMRVVVI